MTDFNRHTNPDLVDESEEHHAKEFFSQADISQAESGKYEVRIPDHWERTIGAEFLAKVNEARKYTIPGGLPPMGRYMRTIALCDLPEDAQFVADAINYVGVLRKALKQIDRTLTVPAAEYVPAISDAFQLIDNALASTESMGD